jgi:signal transduction histidine kinase
VNPSLANRLRIGFAITFALLAGVTVIGVARLFQLRENFEDKLTRSYQLELAGEHLRQTFLVEQATLRGATADRRGATRRFKGATRITRANLAAARELAGDDASARHLLRRRVAADRRWRRHVANPILAGRAPPPAAEQRRLARSVLDAAQAMIAREGVRRESLRSDVTDDTQKTALLVGAGLISGLIAAVLLFSGLISSMRRPLERLVEASGKLASGELRTRVAVSGPAETASLGMAFNEMADELQAAYRRIEESRRRLAITLESLGDGVITVGSDGRVTDANPAARRLVPSADVGASISEALANLGVSGLRVQRLLSGRAREELHVGAGESVLAIKASPLGASEGGTVLSVRDVSERARLERMKDEFVVTASHELRSPLTSVQGFAELLALERERLSPKQRETVEIILANTHHLSRLLDDLLDLARSDAGRLTITRKPSSVEGLVEDAVSLMRERFAARRQRLEVEVEPGLPSVNVDPGRIKQVLVNLLDNAHDYCPDGSEVKVSASLVGREVELAVSDDGPGIPEEQLDHIFERFTRGDAGLTQRIGGTGLGLAIAKSLVELHGGAVGVTSSPGRGSTFRVVLPATGEPSERPGGKKVLERP